MTVCPFVCFSFGHGVACPSSIYGFWLLLWYLQTVLILSDISTRKVLEFPVLLDFESILNVNKSIECDKYTLYAHCVV